jgi:hypothetical protein
MKGLEALNRIRALERKLQQTKAPKVRRPIEDTLARERKSVERHEKEMDQKWGENWRKLPNKPIDPPWESPA